MKSSIVLGLVIVACAVASNGANALPRGSEKVIQKALFMDDPMDYHGEDVQLERVSCDAILQKIVQFIQSLLNRSDGTVLVRSSVDMDDLINDILQLYASILNPNTRVSPLTFAKIFKKLAKVIPIIIDMIDRQIQSSQNQNPPVTPIATTTERNHKNKY